MSKDIVINHDKTRGVGVTVSLRFQSLRSGDVEIVDSTKNGDTSLGIIPKDKRCELAQFLAHEN